MSEATDEIREIADNVDKAGNVLDWIATGENEEDRGRTLADNEVLHRVAQKFRDAADFFDGVVEDPDA